MAISTQFIRSHPCLLPDPFHLGATPLGHLDGHGEQLLHADIPLVLGRPAASDTAASEGVVKEDDADEDEEGDANRIDAHPAAAQIHCEGG